MRTFIYKRRHFTLFDLGKKLLSVGPLWTGLISAWLSPALSRHSLTFPLGFGTSTKLLHHPATSSMPSSVVMSCFRSHSNSSLKNICCVWAWSQGHLIGFAVSCYEQWEHSIKASYSTKISLKSLFSCFVIVVLILLSFSWLGPGKK